MEPVAGWLDFVMYESYWSKGNPTKDFITTSCNCCFYQLFILNTLLEDSEPFL